MMCCHATITAASTWAYNSYKDNRGVYSSPRTLLPYSSVYKENNYTTYQILLLILGQKADVESLALKV